MNEAERTPKLPATKVDHQIISMLNNALREYIEKKCPTNMTEMAKLLQATQISYRDITRKERKPSEWLASIKAKIQKCEQLKVLLDRNLSNGKMTEDEEKTLKKGLREIAMSNKSKSKKDKEKANLLINERIAVYNKKIEMHEKRCDFRKTNTMFELHRARFYRALTNNKSAEHTVPEHEIIGFWNTMWKKEYLLEFPPTGTEEITFPTLAEFSDMIKWIPNWKAAGCDGIHNFFIKEMTCLHAPIHKIIKEICLNGQEQDDWFYRGITYLIPKGIPKRGSDFRPITCMSNLYKITTKCVSKIMQLETEMRGLITENQLGTVSQVQGAKEQVLINIAINKEHHNKLRTTWVDVKKAFDSVNHNYLQQCIKKLNFPDWILRFITSIMSKWEISIRSDNNNILTKKIERGILQGDSLSPLLFVLCLDPLSRKLNSVYPKVNIATEELSYSTNHLLFIDDLKLFSKDEAGAKSLLDETENFFNTIGLEINKEKSATNAATCRTVAAEVSGVEGYKYLGITENGKNEISPKTWERIKKEMITRVENLCQTKLNGKNMMRAINEHAISLINYYVGVLKLEPEEYENMDKEIRQILVKNDIHRQPACKQRLYLPRNELGRGLHNIEHKSESILLRMLQDLTSKNLSLRRKAIMKVEMDNKSHLSQINQYLATKYKMDGSKMNTKVLKEKQKETLFYEINEKHHHKKLYSLRDNQMCSVKNSSVWLKEGRTTPKEEASICFLQDRNIFMAEDIKCPHCKEKKKTVDHMATKCDRMLSHGYTRRHNEVVRCIHMHLCQEYGLKKTKYMRSHDVQETIGNEKVEIRVDTRIRTDIKIKNNKPDIFVLDKIQKTITIIEVGITSQENLQKVETEKLRKYDVLANELGFIYKCKTVIIPYVTTWDGLVSPYHHKYVKMIGIPRTTEAYIQSLVLRKTLECISMEYRRSHDEDKNKNGPPTPTQENETPKAHCSE